MTHRRFNLTAQRAVAIIALTGALLAFTVSLWTIASADQTGRSPFLGALLVAVVTALTGAATALVVPMFLPHGRTVTLEARDAARPLSPPRPDPQLQALREQRETLIRELADLVGKLPPEFEWQAANVLASAGVQPVAPDGHAFDPAVHRAVGTEPTPDHALNDTIARTIRPGWADHERILIPARVVVYVAADRTGEPS